MENYITSQRDHIFKNVQVLIFVFDVDNTETDVCISHDFVMALLSCRLLTICFLHFSL